MTPSLITVKLALVLDCTGSMDPWIGEAREKLHEMIETTQHLHPSALFEVALVAYRDYGDTVRQRVIDFTSPAEIIRALETTYAEGGDDQAEDVAGALHHVCGLTWGPSEVRIVVHIADAPAHGEQFHTAVVSDRFPDGDPSGRNPLFSIRCLAELDIDYTFIRITSSTDRMIEGFHDAYTRGPEGHARFRVLDLHPQTYDGRYGRHNGNMAELLSPAVTRNVTEAVTRYTSSQGG